MAPFRAELRQLDDAHSCGLVIGGEVDLASADTIIGLGLEALQRSEISILLIDLAEVTFIDSTALGALIRLRNSALERGKQLSLDNVPDRVRRLLDITGLGVVFGTANRDRGTGLG